LLKNTTEYLQKVSLKRINEVDESITTQTEKQLINLQDEIKKCLENFFTKTKPILAYIENTEHTIKKQVLLLKNIKDETESYSKNIESNSQKFQKLFVNSLKESENKLTEKFEKISRGIMLQFENRVNISTLIDNTLNDKKTIRVTKNKLKKSSGKRKSRNLSGSTKDLSVNQALSSSSRFTRSSTKQKKTEQKSNEKNIKKLTKHKERGSASVFHNTTETKSELGTSNIEDKNSEDLKNKDLIKAPPSSPTK